MHRVVSSALCLSLVAATALAQGMPAPAKELAKLERLIGTWQGKGTVAMGPGGPTSEWTCTAVVRKVLGGHWIQLDETIEFAAAAGAQPLPDLAFRVFYGFDQERQRYVAHTLSNMGTIETADLQVDDHKIIEATVKMDPEKGIPVFVHWTTEFTNDGYTITGRNTEGASATYVHVNGAMKHAPAGATAKPVNAAFTMGPPTDPAPMQKLAKAAGKYRLAGTMIPVVGQPEVAIGGDLDVHPVWGGQIVEMNVAGNDASAGFQGYAAWAWSPENRSYSAIWVDSTGASVTSTSQMSDDKLVGRTTGTRMGQPFVERSILEFDKDGSFKQERATAITATADPYVCFNAKYEKQK